MAEDGIDMLASRGFTEADHVSSLGNVVVSQSAANLLWPGEDPIGRRMRFANADVWETVVGVVDDVMQGSFRDAPRPLIYFPLVMQSSPAGRPSRRRTR